MVFVPISYYQHQNIKNRKFFSQFRKMKLAGINIVLLKNGELNKYHYLIMKKRSVIGLLILLLSYNFSIAQLNLKFQEPKTPEVYSFEKYGNIPISEYTGVPNITIPLYTVKNGDIQIPLNLSYHSNGIRVQEEASWVGLGWNINMGMISQITKGWDDLVVPVKLPNYFNYYKPEYVVKPQPAAYYTMPWGSLAGNNVDRIELDTANPTNHLDDYYVARVRSDGGFSGYNGIYYPSGNALIDYQEPLTYGLNADYDIETDLFRASFFGHSLVFFIGQDVYGNKSINVLNKKNYKVTVTDKGNDAFEWTITAPDGMQYFFQEQLKLNPNINPYAGRTISSFEQDNSGYNSFVKTTTSNFSSSPKGAARTWKITKIKDTKGNEVNFIYKKLQGIVNTSGYSGHCDFIDSRSKTNTTIPTNGSTAGRFIGPDYSDTNGGAIIREVLDEGKHIKASRYLSTLLQQKSVLREINFKDARIVFNRSERSDLPHDERLDQIEVYYGNKKIKNIGFDLSYFQSTTGSDHLSKRLKLNGISINNQNYNFNYNSTPLPRKNSLSQDYWGYYNGLPNVSMFYNPFRLYEDETLIPDWANELRSQVGNKVNKSSHPDNIKAGILESIQYPTGGFTKFDYELNEFDNYIFPNYDNRTGQGGGSNYVQTKSQGFGLRVKQITDSISPTEKYSKKYTYEGGKHITPFILYDDATSYVSSYFYYPGGDNGQIVSASGKKLTTYATNQYQNDVLANGNHVGYDKVTITEIDAINQANNGKTVSYFTNTPDESIRKKINTVGVLSDENIDLFANSVRGADLDNGLLLRRETFDKNNALVQETINNHITKSHIPTVAYGVKPVSIGGTTHYIFGAAHGGFHHRLFSEYLFFYYPLKGRESVLSHTITRDYLGEDIVEIRHNYEYNSHNQVEKDRSISLSDGKTYTTRYYYPSLGSDLGNENRVGIPIRINRHDGTKTLSDVQSAYRKFPESNNLLLLSEEISCRSYNYPEAYNEDSCRRISYDKYDNEGNILEYHFEDDISVAIVWSYNKMYPVAKIENATFTQVANALGVTETALKNFAENTIPTLDNLRSSLPTAMVTTYTYHPLVGVTTITDPKGQTAYYKYDDSNRLEYVLDQDEYVAQQVRYNYEGQGAAAFENLNITPSISGIISPNQVVTFTSGGIVGNILYTWSIDGVQEQCNTTPGFSTTFTAEGNYTVSLVASNIQTGQSANKTINVSVAYPELSTPSINKNHTYVTHGTSVSFTASGISGGSETYSYEWYVNNVKQSATGTTFQYSSNATATYNVYFKLKDAITGKTKNSSVQKIYVYQALSTPSISANKAPHILKGTSVTFTASGRGYGSGSYRYEWYLNGVKQNGETGGTYTYNFPERKTYTVRFRIVDTKITPTHYKDSNTITMYSYDPLKLSNITSNYGAHVLKNKNVTFTGSNAAGGSGSYSYQWYLGSTPLSSSKQYTRSFASKGGYTMKFVVTDKNIPNYSLSKTYRINAYDPLSAPSITANKTHIVKGTEVTFTASGVGGGSGHRRYEWYVNNVKQSYTGATYKNSFPTAGTYTVKFRVVDTRISPTHSKDSNTRTVYSYNPMQIAGSQSATQINNSNSNVTLRVTSVTQGSGSYSNITWRVVYLQDYSDNYTSTNTSRQFTFGSTKNGEYDITASVRDTKTGQVTSTSFTVIVNRSSGGGGGDGPIGEQW